MSERRDRQAGAARGGLGPARRFASFTAALAVNGLIALGGGGAASAEILIGTAVPLMADFQGEQILRGVEMAVSDLNAAGGVLGDEVRLIAIDDNCDGEQALAAARVFAAERVVFVAGHLCSDASLAAAPAYEEAGILMISPGSTSPRLTEEGRRNVFRVVGRDDQQGTIAAARLAGEWKGARIVILGDDTAYGGGLAAETRRELNRLGVTEVLFETYAAGRSDYSQVIDRLAQADAEIVYVGGNYPELALIVRQARARGLDAQFVAGDGIATEVFWEIAGAAGEGTRFTFFPDPRLDAANAETAERFRDAGFEPEGYTFFGYAAVQAWAQAVARTGSTDASKVGDALRAGEFNTALGEIRFDEKGDLRDNAFVWYVWQDGAYRPEAPQQR